MKKITCIILTFALLTSCSNESPSHAENCAAQNDSVKEAIFPIFNGVWVLTDYIKEIERTKSPLKSSDKLQDVVTMTINGANPTDSIEVGASWNNHEGWSFMLYLVPGLNSNSLKTNIPDYDEKSNFYELGYETVNKDTFLFLYQYDKTNTLIDKKGYTKISDEQNENDAALGLQLMVNEKIFSGNYLMIDSANQSSKIIFNSDGSLTGNPDLKTYYVFTDFMGGPEPSLDEMCFNFQTPNSKFFAFLSENDTIYLYSTTGDEEAGEQLKLDKIKFKLARQKG